MSKSGESRRIEVFRPGTFTAMDGNSYTFSAEDVAAIAGSYDAAAAPAPVVVGHPKHDDPAFGWASGFEVNEAGVLVAELDQLAPAFVEAVKGGSYKKVSMKFFGPTAPSNPKPGSYYPRHIGFLGGSAPAVPGLAPVEFAGPDEGTVEIELAAPEIEFATDYGHKDTARLFRSIREWIIEKFGIEDADKAVDSWTIDWIDDAADAEPSGFSSPEPQPRTPVEQAKPQEEPMSDKDKVREAQLTAREQRLAAAEDAAFADALVNGGHVAAGQRDRLVALLGAVPADAEDVSFADGDETKQVAPRALLKSLLETRPQPVEEGQIVKDGAPTQRAPSFTVPDGYAVDKDDLAFAAEVEAYQADHPELSFADAAIAVERGALAARK